MNMKVVYSAIMMALLLITLIDINYVEATGGKIYFSCKFRLKLNLMYFCFTTNENNINLCKIKGVGKRVKGTSGKLVTTVGGPKGKLGGGSITKSGVSLGGKGAHHG